MSAGDLVRPVCCRRWRAAFTSHVTAVLLLVPLAVVTENRWAGRRLELFVQVLLLAGASVLTFVPRSQLHR